MKRLNKALLWCHRWSGITFAAVFLVVALTGSLLTFRYEIQQAANPDALVVDLGAEQRPDFVAVAAAFERRSPEATLRFLQTNPAKPDFPMRAVIGFPDERYEVHYAHPLTGAPVVADIGEAFWRAMRDLHIFLMAGMPGLFIVFASGWVLIGCSLLGTWLWAPRLKKPRIALGVRWRAGNRKRMLDLHNVTGIYLLVPVLLIALTGVTLILARISPAPLQEPDVAPAAETASVTADAADLRTALATVRAASPDGSIRQIRFPAADGRWFTFEVDEPGAGRRTLYTDPVGAQLLLTRAERDLSFWQQLKGELGVAIHEGYILGTAGRWIVFICGLTLSFGSISGLWLWLVRRRKRRPRASDARLPRHTGAPARR